MNHNKKEQQLHQEQAAQQAFWQTLKPIMPLPGIDLLRSLTFLQEHALATGLEQETVASTMPLNHALIAYYWQKEPTKTLKKELGLKK